jgi:flagellin
MTSQVRGLNQAVRNVNDGINQLQTADGALVETSNMLQRMRELAVQSSNATNSDKQRDYLQAEYSSLQVEITRIASNTTWNQAGLFGVSLVYQAGMSSGQTISVQLASMDATSLGVSALNTISTFAKSQAALGLIDSAVDIVNAARSTMGAVMNQLSYSADNMVNISTNIGASRSTIMDTDYATASAQ